MNREQLFRYFFIGVFLLLLYQVLLILSPFYTGILGAIVLTLISLPLHRLVLDILGRNRPSLAAAISSALVLVLIVIPVILFSWLLLNELNTVKPIIERFTYAVGNWSQGERFIEAHWFIAIEDKLREFLSLPNIDLQNLAKETANLVLAEAAGLGKKVPRNAFIFAINMLIMIFTLFFLFRDGHSLFRKFKDLIPMDIKHKDQIAHQLYLTVTAVVRGVFIVAVAQGTAAGIGFSMAGVPASVVLGFSTVLLALIPMVGAAAVWIPVSLYYFVQGLTGKAIFLCIWGLFVVSLVDNFLRPILIGYKARLPVLFLFFGILGGIKIYGPMGLFLGPLVIALVLAFIRIYREEYQKEFADKESA